MPRVWHDEFFVWIVKAIMILAKAVRVQGHGDEEEEEVDGKTDSGMAS